MVMGWLFTYNAIIILEFSKNSPFSFLVRKSAVRHLILSAATTITPHKKSYEITVMTMHSFVKYNISGPSVSLCNSP